MIFIDEKVLTETKEANQIMIVGINERLLDMVSEFIRVKNGCVSEEKIDRLFNGLFPDNYPENKRYDKLVDLRTTLSDRKMKDVDSISKYILHMCVERYIMMAQEVFGTTIIPFDNKTRFIKTLLQTGKYEAKDILYIVKMYEDVNYYIEILFGNYDFLDLEDMSEQELLRLELKELVEAKRKEKMAPMM